MKLPRDLSGEQLARLLAHTYGYRPRRSRGSHQTVTLTTKTAEHSVTIPLHRPVRIGTLRHIVSDVAAFLGLPAADVRQELFGE